MSITRIACIYFVPLPRKRKQNMEELSFAGQIFLVQHLCCLRYVRKFSLSSYVFSVTTMSIGVETHSKSEWIERNRKISFFPCLLLTQTARLLAPLCCRLTVQRERREFQGSQKQICSIIRNSVTPSFPAFQLEYGLSSCTPGGQSTLR